MAPPFPITRLRRLRQSAALRGMVRETTVTAQDLIQPLFIEEGIDDPLPIAEMPGVSRIPERKLPHVVEGLARDGVKALMLFGISHHKDASGSDAWNRDGLVARMVRGAKRAAPELVVIPDICFCEYTDHGHCGVLHDGELDNDASLENLARTVVSYAKAGVDVVAPSGMLDGFVGACRESLDEDGHDQVAILAYSAKYASGYYGPFREAVESAPQEGDRRGHQMDPANVAEAIREVSLDVAEGADIVMVKPALAYLDVIRAVSDEVNMPVCAYNVSGEYAMIEAAAERGWIDKDRIILETLTGIRRAGADMIISYHAPYACKLLQKQR
jgi:porphobilinogen synthase